QRGQGFSIHQLVPEGYLDDFCSRGMANHMTTARRFDGMALQHSLNFEKGGTRNLNDVAEFFVEQSLEHPLPQGIEGNTETASPGESHFDQRREQTAVGTVVVREQQPLLVQLLHGIERSLQAFWNV